jgi:UDP-N-acetylglucosamine transferase subunit ALG13
VLSQRPLSGARDLTTFVTVGNATQAFDRLLSSVQRLTDLLPRPIIVQRGVSKIDHAAWETRDFLQMEDFQRSILESSLLIMHAGAGSVIHAIRSGRRAIVMPRRMKFGEHVDDHQLEFAKALADAGYVHLALDESDLAAAITSGFVRVLKPHDNSTAPLLQHVSALLHEWASGRAR